MPQRQHCPPKQRRGDKNPDCHEEQQKKKLCKDCDSVLKLWITNNKAVSNQKEKSMSS
jgi:hypothetical protein